MLVRYFDLTRQLNETDSKAINCVLGADEQTGKEVAIKMVKVN